MDRKKARSSAFQCIYQMNFDQKFDAQKTLAYCYEENQNDEKEQEYISEVVQGVEKHLSEIDEIIFSYLKNWTIDRIFKIDLAILRLAIYEMNYMENIPLKVSANEAVELAKEYGSDESKSFVNGLLAKVIESKVDH